eukprot:c15512_g1_i1.p1 GENE.c15512_g1_i1~~c15512_g1_i1.p1  ORF type:complete len:143 (+),score=38.92 c15512_g1_i1:22-450(+)
MIKDLLFILFISFLALSNAVTTVGSKNFEELVVQDSRVWMIEFYSSMCGSCKEFAGTWKKLSTQYEKSVMIGHVDIDKKDGKKLAMDLGVLEEGIPNVKLFNANRPITIMASEIEQFKTLTSKIDSNLKSLSKDEKGVYLRG